MLEQEVTHLASRLSKQDLNNRPVQSLDFATQDLAFRRAADACPDVTTQAAIRGHLSLTPFHPARLPGEPHNLSLQGESGNFLGKIDAVPTSA